MIGLFESCLLRSCPGSVAISSASLDTASVVAVERIGIDEGYLVLAEGDPPEQAAIVQQAIREQVRLSSSLGVGACKVVCKIASDMRKPGGMACRRGGVPGRPWRCGGCRGWVQRASSG